MAIRDQVTVDGFVRVFRPRPADPNRASGKGRDGSDPPFVPLAQHGGGGSVTPGVTLGVTHPPAVLGGVAPVFSYSCGKAPTPAPGRREARRGAARCLTDSSAPFSSSAA